MRAGRRADSAGRLYETVDRPDYASLGAIPKEPRELFVLSTKINEPEVTAAPYADGGPGGLTLTAIPETPDPFGLQVRRRLG